MDEKDHEQKYDDATSDDDVIFEEEDGSINPQEAIKKLRQKLALAVKEKQEYLLGWQKTQADFVNLRKRDELEKIEKEKYSSASVLNDILPALDSFDLAKDSESWNVVHEEWRKGIESIFDQLGKGLAKHGLGSYGAIGEKFDPNRHDAVTVVDSDSEEHDDCIATVFQKGYMLHDRVIRPAKVAVWRHK